MTKEIQKWADKAMFKAEPINADDGPQVQLLSCNNDPLGSIAAAAKAYKGEFVTSLAEITDEERRYYLQQMQKTALAMPLESVHFQFHISGVTRSFTHQMVRQRTAAYSQESMRFAVKDPLPVGLPPWLEGTKPWAEYVKDCRNELYPNSVEPFKPGSPKGYDEYRAAHEYADNHATPQQIARREWDWTVDIIGKQYNALINFGMPAEDARGLAPHATLTQINYHTNLRNFVDEGGKRLCTQAQFEWRIVFSKMLEAMREYGQHVGYRYQVSPPTGGHAKPEGPFYGTKNSGWQFDAIADLFRPVCYLTGSCQFEADFDRKCSIRERVDANRDCNRPSSEWHEILWGITPEEFQRCPSPEDVEPIIPAIDPAEWLLDPNAAR